MVGVVAETLDAHFELGRTLGKAERPQDVSAGREWVAVEVLVADFVGLGVDPYEPVAP